MDNPFKGRHFRAEIILICTRWYLRYSLSYRDIEEMMTERSLSVDHTTIYRWVQKYTPELDKRSRQILPQDSDKKAQPHNPPGHQRRQTSSLYWGRA